MEIEKGLCIINGVQVELKFTLGVANEIEKKFGGFAVGLSFAENVKGACDILKIMLVNAFKKHNREWNTSIVITDRQLNDELLEYLKTPENAINIIENVKMVIERDKKFEPPRKKPKKKNKSSNARGDIKTIIISCTSALGIGYNDALDLTIYDYSVYLNRYNEINNFDDDDNNNNNDDVDESYEGVGNLKELLHPKKKI